MKRNSAVILAAGMSLPAKILLVLGIILLIVLVIAIVIGVVASKNVKSMDAALNGALAKISKHYQVTEIPCEDYSEIKVYGVMKFHVNQYEVEGIGNLAVMKVNMGFMQMFTMVITPNDKNLPLVSADYMYIMGKRKSYLEFYDFVPTQDEPYKQLLSELEEVKKTYDELEDVEPTPAWYDSLKTVGIYKGGTSDNDTAMSQMMLDSLEVFLSHAETLPRLSDEQILSKANLTREYSEGLISKGGVSTDVFKKALGEDTTRDFFNRVLFKVS